MQYSEEPVFAIDTTYFVDPSTTQQDLRWLLYALSTAHLHTLGRDVGVPGLNRDSAYVQKIPLPALQEQRAIADFLDAETARTDTLIDKKRRMLQLLEERERSAIDSLFGQDGTGVRLGYVAQIQTGLTLDARRARSSNDVTRPYLRVANVQPGWLDLTEVKEVTVSSDLADRVALQVGDVLMTEGGDLDKLGRGTVWRGEIATCLHQNHVFAVRPDPEQLDSEYLALVTRTSHARSYFERTGSRTTNLASTSASKVADFRVALPSLPVQRELVAEYGRSADAHTSLTAALGRQIDLLIERRQALITTAVTGELDPARPTTEEAS